MIWYTALAKRMEDGVWVEQRKGDPFQSDPAKCYVAVVLHEDYLALQAQNAELEALRESLQNRLASRPLNDPDLIAENERLRAGIQEAIDHMHRDEVFMDLEKLIS